MSVRGVRIAVWWIGNWITGNLMMNVHLVILLEECQVLFMAEVGKGMHMILSNWRLVEY